MRFLSERDKRIYEAQVELAEANDEFNRIVQSGELPSHVRLMSAREALYNAMNSEYLYECFGCGEEFNPFSEDMSHSNCFVLGISSVIFHDGSRMDYDPADTRHIAFCLECTNLANLLAYLIKR